MIMAFVGTPRTRCPLGSSIILDGTFLSVSSFKRKCAALSEGASPLYPITTPSSPISPIKERLITCQPAIISVENNISSVRFVLASAILRNSTCIPARGFSAFIKELCSPISIGKFSFFSSITLSLRRASAFASLVLVSVNCISSCFAANSFVEARSFANATSFSSRIVSGMACASAKNSIHTPTATAVMNCNSLRRWCDSWDSFAGFRNRYHSPAQPIATNPRLNISQQTQNQKEGSTKKPTTEIEIVAKIAQIVFGILILTGVCFFWKITCASQPTKK